MSHPVIESSKDLPWSDAPGRTPFRFTPRERNGVRVGPLLELDGPSRSTYAARASRTGIIPFETDWRVKGPTSRGARGTLPFSNLMFRLIAVPATCTVPDEGSAL